LKLEVSFFADDVILALLPCLNFHLTTMKYTLSLFLLLPVFFFAPVSTAAQLLSAEAAACGIVSFSPAQLLRYHSGDELQIAQTTGAGSYLTTIELVDTEGPDFAPTIAQSLTNRLPAGMYVAIARNPQTKAFVGQAKIIIK
jgi:hypothetical protein